MIYNQELGFKDLDNENKLTNHEILYTELKEIIEDVNNFISSIKYDLAKNLEQHLIKFKEENNLDGLSEEDKIYKFIGFVDNQELEYFNSLKDGLEKKLTNLMFRNYNLSIRIKDLVEKQEDFLKFENKGFFKSKALKLRNFIVPKYKNIKIYQFKVKYVYEITNSLGELSVRVKNITSPKNNINIDKIKDELKTFNKFYTLDSFVKENPLFQLKHLKYMDLKPYSDELKTLVSKYKLEINKIEKDLNLNPVKQFDLLSKRITDNVFSEIINTALFKTCFKPIQVIKDNISIPNEQAYKNILVSAIVIIMSTQITNTTQTFLKQSSLDKIPHIEEIFKIASSERDNIIKNGIDFEKAIKDNNISISKNSIEQIKECIPLENSEEMVLNNINKNHQIDIS